MSAGKAVEVPGDTSSWEEAQASGFHGERTDPLPDEVYSPEFGEDDLPADLTAVDPAEQDAAIETSWSMTCTGTFPLMDARQWRVVILAPDDSEWTSLDITAVTVDTVTAHFVGGPNYPGVEGESVVLLRHGDEDKGGPVPFTWNYTGPPAGNGEG